MRRPRLKMDATTEDACYHCMSRVVGEEWLLDEQGKEVLRKQMWALAEYCGVAVITYALMSNHYHILLRVPVRRSVGDEELLRLYRLLHPDVTAHQERFLCAVEKDMQQNGELAQRWREKQLRQMFDVSVFNKLLKMRFSIWYNKVHERVGTLWAERFKSVLVEEGAALEEMAAYIDLNAFRAGLVKDPKDYRFCGYAEAVAGERAARQGLCFAMKASWSEAGSQYRGHLLGRMSSIKEGENRLKGEQWKKATKDQGRMPLMVECGSRIRYFVDGVILGSEDYVRQKAQMMSGPRKREPRRLLMTGLNLVLHVPDRLLREASS